MPPKKKPQKTKETKEKKETVLETTKNSKKVKAEVDSPKPLKDAIDFDSLPKVKPPNVKAYKETDSQPDFPLDYEVVKNCLLQVTDIKDNHNKFYSLELHLGSTGKGRLFTHYGRTDDLQRLFIN